MSRVEVQSKCAVCGVVFLHRAGHVKYCPACREAAYDAIDKKGRRAKYRYEKIKETVYVCDVCGRRILAHGRVNTRKTCDECLSDMGEVGRKRMMERKQVKEEVLPDE